MTAVLGLVVNPVAGLGGPAALKGSDGPDVQALALARGAVPRASERAASALRALPKGTPVLTCAGAMGSDAVAAAGCVPEVAFAAAGSPTTAADTRAAVRALRAAGASLVLFAGGDGTARDAAAAVADDPDAVVLGIPAGVKMYSPCFALSPAVAGRMAAAWAHGARRTASVEVLDVSEDAVRGGRVLPQVFASVRVPVSGGRTQAGKVPAAAASDALDGLATAVVNRLEPGVTYLLGPGRTLAAVASALGVPKTPLGFDAVRDGTLVLADATAAQLAELAHSGDTRAVVTVIGGQGFLLGRGNQQLTAEVVAALGTPPLLVAATADKLASLGGPLLVDTGDPETDRRLAGFVRVITGIQDTAIVQVIGACDSTDERD